jgi:TolA-binding protein
MKKILLAIAILSLFCVNPSGAQNTIQSGSSAHMSSGIELYKNKMYSSALNEFNKELEQSGEKNSAGTKAEEAAGYKVLCQILLKQPNLEGIVKNYESDYPASSLLPQIKFRLAISEFENDKYSDAMKILDKMDADMLAKEDRDEFFFRKGYCQMRTGSYQEARQTFNYLTSSNDKGPYASAAYYYLGYMDYMNKEFTRAIPSLEKAKSDPRFTVMSKFHILDSKFMLKDYNYVINNGPEVYKTIEQTYKPRVARIISESYYATGDAQNARKFFNMYSSGGGISSRSDNFYAGMIAYTLKDYDTSITRFSRVKDVDDSLGQSANYHIGQCYIQLKNKPAAEEAFRSAACMRYDKAIEEDAYFNYAKLDFDLTGETSRFTDYLNNYKVTESKQDEIYGYIATGALTKKDYDQAISALSKIKKPTETDLVNLKKANFFKGAKLLDEGSYSASAEYLAKATENESYNPSLTNLAKFWQAECNFRQGKYAESQKILSELQKNLRFKQSKEYSESYFNSGYNYFKLKDLANAKTAFETYLNFPQSQRSYTNDAKTRLADCYFMERNFSKAAELYEKIGAETNYSSLYAPLQGAIARGFMSDNAKKISELRNITGASHRESPLYTEALFELGCTQVQNSNDKDAMESFNKLINNPPDSIYYYKALLEIGMINSNRHYADAAIKNYKEIIDKQPNSQEAQTALSALENIYQNQNRSEEFLEYVQSNGAATAKTPAEKETLIFNSAEQIYMSGKYEPAIKALESFTERYPSGQRYEQAMFYLAECYRKTDNAEKAIECYHKVMESGEGALSESATKNYADLCYKLEKYSDAARGYETLEKTANFKENKLEAVMGEMRSYFCNKEYKTASLRAEQIISDKQYGAEQRDEAMYYEGRSLLALGERVKAIESLKKLSENPKTALGAEAAYLVIQDSFDNGKFDKVEKQTFTLSKSKTPQTYWMARSFIVLGDSYAERGNKEQALATYKSIRDNYKGKDDDIISTVTARINKTEEK